jgi:N-ethylmaleimide reductase
MRKILSPFNKNGFQLKNHIVMAPMTRSRAIGNLPNDLMTSYYRQRTGAGLIITEGTAPAPEGLGYARIPGIFSKDQIAGWKNITDAVHQEGTKIFLQLMHTGRIAHQDNLPEGASVVGASAMRAAGQIFTDTAYLQDYSEPVALTTEGVEVVINQFVTAAENAIKAGFDGVELHGANGYLLEQFLNPTVNNRTDRYGGSIENRSRFILEIAEKIARSIGKGKIGIRFSPFSTSGDLPAYEQEAVTETYRYLAQELDKIGIVYIHISANTRIPEQAYTAIRSHFNGVIILCNGLNPDTAEDALEKGFADLVAFGRNFLANPDYVQRIETGSPLNEHDHDTYYTAGEKGYTDYPTLASKTRQKEKSRAKCNA